MMNIKKNEKKNKSHFPLQALLFLCFLFQQQQQQQQRKTMKQILLHRLLIY